MRVAEPPARRCATELDTIALGERIGVLLRPGSLVSLNGPLGAGKTVLVRGIAAGCGADPRTVRSPTFVLHQVYAGSQTLHHIDLYRLGADADLSFLDLDGLLERGAVVVEWGELGRLASYAPARVTVVIESDGVRRIELETPDHHIAGAWSQAAELV